MLPSEASRPTPGQFKPSTDGSAGTTRPQRSLWLPVPFGNLADTLTDMGHDAEALPHWKAYLQVDSQSERAAYARRCIA